MVKELKAYVQIKLRLVNAYILNWMEFNLLEDSKIIKNNKADFNKNNLIKMTKSTNKKILFNL
jgi:hypothetical protein